MKTLLRNPGEFYKPKERPSGHDIGDQFGKDNGGAIPPNLLQISNTDSNSHYLRTCKLLGQASHPARFPIDLPRFFIKFLTEPDDLVIDIFSGSNTTGYAAEELNRRWTSIEMDHEYACLSGVRFLEGCDIDQISHTLGDLQQGNILNLSRIASHNNLKLALEEKAQYLGG